MIIEAEALVLLLMTIAVGWLLAVARLLTVDVGVWLVGAVDLLLSMRLLAVGRRLLSMRLLAIGRRRLLTVGCLLLLTVAWCLAVS